MKKNGILYNDLIKLRNKYIKQVEENKRIMESDPVMDLFNLHKEFSEMLKGDREALEFKMFLEEGVKKERELKKQIKLRAVNFDKKNIEERINYEHAISDLNRIIGREFAFK